MTEQTAHRFAEAIEKEEGLIADTFDGTVGDGAFRNRVATLYYAIAIFQVENGMPPSQYLLKEKFIPPPVIEKKDGE